MIIAFVYGAWGVGDRPFNMNALWSDARGLTGSELSFFSLARELASRNHKITIFTRYQSRTPCVWEGCDVLDIDCLNPQVSEKFDAICSWNEPDILRQVSPKCIRLVNQQLNDFGYCYPGYDDFVDVYTSPSYPHREYIRTHTPSPHKWEVLENGCDPSQYPNIEKISGRVIYASSPDRGLHLLLQEWPKIRRAVPNAHLRVFYNFASWFDRMSNQSLSQFFDIRECAHRALYIREAFRRLKDMGVEHCHSISRDRMAREMAEAQVLAYPCDTVRYTEGFSVTLMEACASRTLPVTSSVDSLGDIYGGIVPMVSAPVNEHLDEFTSLVIRGLTDTKWSQSVVEKTSEFAQKYKWSLLADKLEFILMSKVFNGQHSSSKEPNSH